MPIPRYAVDLGREPVPDDDVLRYDGSGWEPAAKRAMTDIAPRESVAVLGEPGIGKSTAIAAIVANDAHVNVVRLDEATDVRVLEELLSPSLDTTTTGSPGTLVLDGVDECPLPPKTLIRRVENAVKAVPGVRVVVGCRTADWPAGLGDTLARSLGAFTILELLPLSLDDVATLARSRKIEPATFIAAVQEASAVPLAILPLTLDLLLTIFSSEGGLPASAADLYERGLLLLAADPDAARARDKKPVGSDEQRLAVAARIAAYLMLCARSAVSLATPPADADLGLGVFGAGTEQLSTGEFAVTMELVEGTLATALFSGRGPARLGVTHASFAAYLTARYLTTQGVTEDQLRALLTRTSSLGSTSIPSRLRETASWLVALNTDHNGWIVDVDPENVAAHSGLVTNVGVRTRLVEHLLSGDDHYSAIGRRQWRLQHPGLAEQLRPWLRAPLVEDAGPDFGHPVSRRAGVAIGIARQSADVRLVPDLADVVAASKINSYLRTAAAYALLDLDPTRAANVLRPVLDEVHAHPGRDPDDELRGLALEACWPDHVAVSDLVTALTMPQRRNFFGAYAYFLSRFVDVLTDDAVGEILRAVAKPVSGRGADALAGIGEEWADEEIFEDPAPPSGQLSLLLSARRGAQVMTELLARALASPRLAEFAEEAGWLLATCLNQHQDVSLPQSIGGGSLTADALVSVRRAVVVAAARHMEGAYAGQIALLQPTVPIFDTDVQLRAPSLVDASDLRWLFQLGVDLEPQAAAMIRQIFDPTNIEHQEIAWEWRGKAIFQRAVGHWFEAVDCASEIADRMRDDHAWMVKRKLKKAAPDAHAAALEQLWDRCRVGDVTAFHDLCRRFRTDPTTHGAEWGDAADPTSWPSFDLLHPDIGELVVAAEAYLSSTDLSSQPWLTQVAPLPPEAITGYAAMALCARHGRIGALPDHVLRRWLPVVTRYVSSGHTADTQMRSTIVGALIRVSADEFIQWSILNAELKVAAGWSLRPLDDLRDVYDVAVGDRLFSLLQKAADCAIAAHAVVTTASEPQAVANARSRFEVARNNVKVLSSFLAENSHAPAIAYLGTLASSAASAPSEVGAVAALAVAEVDATAWPAVFARMGAEDAFGLAVVAELARDLRDPTLFRTLDEPRLAELWAWIEARWRSADDVMRDGWVTEDQRIRDRRNAIIDELEARATPAALHALSCLAAGSSDNWRLRQALANAEKRERDEVSPGVAPEEFSALLADSRRTVLTDDDALYRAVLASLRRFAHRVDQVGQLLWNETRAAGAGTSGAMVWRPKYEADVSAALADHLRMEFGADLVVGREVLVRQTGSKGQGLSVDVLPAGVNSIDGYRLPLCPIEVKGCWNDGLLSGLQAQLVDDYLAATGATRGIYVCAWFPVEEWDDVDDPRWRKVKSANRDAVVRGLEEEARRLSASRNVEVAVIVVDIPRPHPSERANR